ncbi:MAG TPA: bis(5'-nucleosyl)-tetraphosphatase [Tepidisphaeraceae bacterium]|nr:bis(5'-nucleosyl)-tetraphosphatase [Tepidisphaeraceae bacterium]
MARHERSAGFVVFRNEPDDLRRYLVLDYGRHWDFAKGHLEKGEDDLTAALRELREETGITDVEPVKGFQHEITYFFRDRKKGLIRKTVVFFLGMTRTPDSRIVVSHEHEAFAFLPFDDAVKRITYPNAKSVLRLAEQKLREEPASGQGDSLSSDVVKS